MAENEIVVEEEVPPSSSSSSPLIIVEEDDGTEELKHLGFVRTAATYLVVCLSTIYELAKDNAGPLRLGVENIEATVETVLSPLYERFSDVPFKLLLFVDRKVVKAIPISIFIFYLKKPVNTLDDTCCCRWMMCSTMWKHTFPLW